MKTFKQFISENKKTVDDILQIIQGWNKISRDKWNEDVVDKFEVEFDGSVAFYDHITTIHDFMLDAQHELPFQFYKCNALHFEAPLLKSFKNFPEFVYGDDFNYKQDGGAVKLAEGRYNNITSLEGLDINAKNCKIDFSQCKNLSYTNVHKHIKGARGVFIANNYVGPLLGFLMIPNLQEVKRYISSDADLNHALEILNTHLAGERDLIDCQQELIEAGLKQYANIK